MGQQKYLWQQAAQELQEENQEQKHELKKLKRTLQVWQEDCENVIGGLDEGRRRWGIFGLNFCVIEKRDRKWIEGFEIEFFRFC